MAINNRIAKSTLALGVSVWALSSVAFAQDFAIPSGDLQSALANYSSQTGVNFVVSSDELKGVQTKGVSGNLSANEALIWLLSGTGFEIRHYSSGKIGLSRGEPHADMVVPLQLAQASPPQRAAVETVTVTSSKLGGADVQSIPISITALSQEQLTATQTAGGPDLVKQVPNLTFTKTNFTGYSITIRGIGTQAISVATDPAVAVALNDVPFIRNHFFEQEFYDVSQVEVLRGPQGTLYGRNATAGVVNVVTAKPTDQFEAMASADIGNYHNRRFEGMINIPIVDDRLDIRAAGEWTKRNGYSINDVTGQPVDGRDLWSGRLTIDLKPVENLQMTLVWEHFQEHDDRMRTAKQLCESQQVPSEIGGALVPTNSGGQPNLGGAASTVPLTQGCRMTSLYSANAFEEPNAYALPYVGLLGYTDRGTGILPYTNSRQSPNLRDIEATINPIYEAKNDTIELNSDYRISPSLTFTSQTAYNNDFLWSTEDYNRFEPQPGIFNQIAPNDDIVVGPTFQTPLGGTAGTFCDPQLGCSNRLVAQDLSDEHAWQLSQEFRLASNFSGPLNFSVGGNYLHYETEENYYVFINLLTLWAAQRSFWNIGGQDNPLYGVHANGGWTPGPLVWTPGVSDNIQCLKNGTGYYHSAPARSTETIYGCSYIDPNPITNLDNQGHNYFLSQNPYGLNSYAGFGEVYYNITSDLRLTGGVRWTEDQKHFIDIPSEVVTPGYGYPVTGVIDQQWDQFTGRAVADWTPKLNFTDQTLIYTSFAHGYKAGGANPPGAMLLTFAGGDVANPIHPLTFKPEFIDAYELGTKNTALDGALTVNGDVFFYNYKGYQISEIVDRSAINLNFNATVKGAELETSWQPAPGLKFSFAGGYEETRLANGSHAVDLMDRTAGNPNWMVIKPFPTQASNCIMPVYVLATQLANGLSEGIEQDCERAYSAHIDPVTCSSYVEGPSGPRGNDPACNDNDNGGTVPAGYPGFDPVSNDPNAPGDVNNGLGQAPNNGEGFDKNLSGNQLPNAPRFTLSASADYTVPLTADWAGTAHIDYYWQDYSWARIFNDNPYDRLRGYTNINLALILTGQNGWQVMGYVKNIFNVTDITGAFLNSDDSGLTTNVFLTDPRLFGVRVTKNW